MQNSLEPRCQIENGLEKGKQIMTERKATDVQKRKYEKFIKHELSKESAAFLNQLIQYSGLEISEIGVNWGVTVLPDAMTVIRVNIGNYEFARVTQSESGEEGQVMLCVKGKPQLPVLHPTSLSWRKSGFKALDDDFAMFMTLGRDSTKVLGMKKIQAGIREGAKSRMKRGLPNPNWHNPMTEELIAE
jgi:hypothetical protein